MIPEAIDSIGLILLVQLLYTLGISAAVGLMIWLACRRERLPRARRVEKV